MIKDHISASIESISGSAGNDILVGTTANDVFNLTRGGSDVVCGLGGSDTFNFGAAWDSGDFVVADAGVDHVILDGSYTGHNSIALITNQMEDVELVNLRGDTSYRIVAADGAFGSSQTGMIKPITFTMTNLGPDSHVTINDGAETAVEDRFACGNDASYHLTGGQFVSQVYFGGGFDQNDWVHGNSGNDLVAFNSDFLQPTQNQDYTGSNAIDLVAKQLLGVDRLGISGGFDYKITTHDFAVGAGKTLVIDENGFNVGALKPQPAMGTNDHLTFDGSGETDGSFVFLSGNGTDYLTGGSQADTFSYDDGITLSGATRDVITGFDFHNDMVQFSSVSGLDTEVTAGTLSGASIDTDLQAIFGSGGSNPLGALHAVLFKPDAGDLAGTTFLIVDGDNVAGYTPGSDLVVQLSNPLNAGDIGLGNFIGPTT